VKPRAVRRLVRELARRHFDVAIVLTSDHQSPLPMALLLRLAGVEHIVAASHDYPGSLLSVRHPPGGPHEVQRNLSLVAAAGFAVQSLDEGDPSTRLAVRRDLPDVDRLPGLRGLAGHPGSYVVVHPKASVPARSLGPGQTRDVVEALVQRGHRVVVTGGPADRPLPDGVPDGVVDLTGRTSLAQLAALLRGARCVVATNTGPAHLAAAVGTPVVSLFAPVVPVEAWRPWGVPHVVLGDLAAGCAGTRARVCPLAQHTCLPGVPATTVADAVMSLSSEVVA
jgi:ADP-heptose:LPS heptosyltransferase